MLGAWEGSQMEKSIPGGTQAGKEQFHKEKY